MRRALAVLVAAFVAAGAAGAAAITADSAPTPAPDAGPVQVFVRGADHVVAETAAVEAGLEVIGRFETIGFVAAAGAPDRVARLGRDPRVLSTAPVVDVKLDLETSHKATRTHEAQAGVPELDLPPTIGRGVTIAINDSGVDGTHPMLQSQVVRNLRYAFGRYVDVPDSDFANGHGTHVAGIAAGARVQTILGRKLVGAAPGAKIVALGSGAGPFALGTLEGLDWVLANHADPCGDGSCPPIRVVNNSWSSNARSYDPKDPTSVAVNSLVRRGVVVVFSAGNQGGDGSTNTVSFESQNPTRGVIAVANYNDRETGTRDGVLASGSSRGKRGRVETYPDVSAPGTNITSACRVTLPICYRGDEPNYGTIGGTSMAAPHVAGIVAQLLEANPTLSPAQVEDILEDTAHRFVAGGPYEPDPTNDTTPTSFDKGHGLVDALAAVAAARSLPGAAPRPEPTAGAVAAPTSHSVSAVVAEHDPPATPPAPPAVPALPALELPALPRQKDLVEHLSNL